MATNLDAEIEAFNTERNAVLLSMDERKIRGFYRKYQLKQPDHPIAFWGAVHKARTGIASLPDYERRNSKRWLEQHGMTSYDDGNL